MGLGQGWVWVWKGTQVTSHRDTGRKEGGSHSLPPLLRGVEALRVEPSCGTTPSPPMLARRLLGAVDATLNSG